MIARVLRWFRLRNTETWVQTWNVDADRGFYGGTGIWVRVR